MWAHTLFEPSDKGKKDVASKLVGYGSVTSGQGCSRTSWQSMHVINLEMRIREMCLVTREFQARKPPSAWLYSSAASAWGWGTSCSFPPWWHRSPPLSRRRTCSDQPQIMNMDNHLVGSGEHVIREQIATHFRRPSKCAGVPGTMVLMKKGCWPRLSS